MSESLYRTDWFRVFSRRNSILLEIVSYDANNSDSASKEYAKVKPHKVIEAMKEFSKDRYNVDVLKVEVPVNMNFVEGFGTESLYSQDEAQAFSTCKVKQHNFHLFS